MSAYVGAHQRRPARLLFLIQCAKVIYSLLIFSNLGCLHLKNFAESFFFLPRRCHPIINYALSGFDYAFRWVGTILGP
jgi:hypothetical protein